MLKPRRRGKDGSRLRIRKAKACPYVHFLRPCLRIVFKCVLATKNFTDRLLSQAGNNIDADGLRRRLNDMKLPKTSVDEDRPFLGTKKTVRIAMDNLAQAPSQRSKYGAHSTSSLFRRLLQNTLVKWILLVLALLLVFVMGSSYWSSVPSTGFSAAEVPELDFTLDNLISASIGLSAMAAERIQDVKV